MNTDKSVFWRLLGLLAAAIAVFIGYPPEGYYESYYLPFIFKYMDPRLYPADLFVNSESVYHSLFFPMIAQLLRYADLKILFPALCFVATCANIALVFNISLLLFKNRATALLAVLLLFFGKFALSLSAIGILTAGLCEPSGMARPFLLFAIYLFLKEKYLAACLIAGLMFNVQGMEAFFVAAMFMFYFLTRIKSLPRSQVLYPTLLLALPALPPVLNALSRGFLDTASPEAVRQWLAIVHFRSFYHLFPFSWGLGDWFSYCGWLIWTYVVLKYSRPSEKHDVITSFCKALGLLCLIGTVFVELIPVPAVVKLVLWRGTMFYVFFLVIYISDYLVNFPKENPLQTALVAGTASGLLFNSFSFYKLIPCFALLHLAFQMRHKKFVSILAALAGTAGICAFTAGSILPLKGGSYLMDKLLSFARLDIRDLCLFYVSFPAFLWLLYLWESWSPKKRAVLLVALLTAVFAVRFGWPKNIQEEQFRKDWKDVQLWARKNTPEETVFITPSYLEGFRIHSQRGIVAENKDGAACVYDIGFTFKWWERMNDLGFSNLAITVLDFVPESRRNYAALGIRDIRRLSAKYCANYIVTEEPKGPELKLVYKNSRFNIYATQL